MINHIDKYDIKAFLDSSVTKHVFALIIEHFNHQKWLYDADESTSVARYKGRAEILDYLYNPTEILKLMDHKGDDNG